jgi:hypothetical protein
MQLHVFSAHKYKDVLHVVIYPVQIVLMDISFQIKDVFNVHQNV